MINNNNENVVFNYNDIMIIVIKYINKIIK